MLTSAAILTLFRKFLVEQVTVSPWNAGKRFVVKVGRKGWREAEGNRRGRRDADGNEWRRGRTNADEKEKRC